MTSPSPDLRHLRLQLGLTQQALAHLADVSLATITRAERGDLPRRSTVRNRLFRILGVPFTDGIAVSKRRVQRSMRRMRDRILEPYQHSPAAPGPWSGAVGSPGGGDMTNPRYRVAGLAGMPVVVLDPSLFGWVGGPLRPATAARDEGMPAGGGPGMGPGVPVLPVAPGPDRALPPSMPTGPATEDPAGAWGNTLSTGTVHLGVWGWERMDAPRGPVPASAEAAVEREPSPPRDTPAVDGSTRTPEP
jgi:transcriptional regulator with XRE-family HTH domain